MSRSTCFPSHSFPCSLTDSFSCSLETTCCLASLSTALAMPRKVLSKPDVSIFTCSGGTVPGRYDCPTICPGGPCGPTGPCGPGGPLCPSSVDPSSPGSPSGDPLVLLLLETSGLWQSGGGHPPGLLPDVESPSSPGELPSSPPGVCLGLL